MHQFSVGVQRCSRAPTCSSSTSSGVEGRNLANLIEPQPAAQGRSGPLALPELRLHRVARAEGHLELQGHGPLAREALLERLRRQPGLHALASAPTRAASTSRRAARRASRRTRRTWRPGRGRAASTRGTASSANFVAELPFAKGKKRALDDRRDPRRTGRSRASSPTAPAGPSPSSRAATTSGSNMTGMPNKVGSGEGPETVDEWFESADFQAVPSGTFGNAKPQHPARARLAEPGLQPAEATSRSAARRSTCAGTSSTSSTASTSACPTRTSRTPRPSARSAASRATRASCSSRCGSCSSAYRLVVCARPPSP